MKGFALGLALELRRKATRKSPIPLFDCAVISRYIEGLDSGPINAVISLLR